LPQIGFCCRQNLTALRIHCQKSPGARVQQADANRHLFIDHLRSQFADRQLLLSQLDFFKILLHLAIGCFESLRFLFQFLNEQAVPDCLSPDDGAAASEY
jgi:hypothetical protein